MKKPIYQQVADILQERPVTPKEVSEMFSISEGSARNRIRKAKNMLGMERPRRPIPAPKPVAVQSPPNTRLPYSVGNPVTMSALWRGLERWRATV